MFFFFFFFFQAEDGIRDRDVTGVQTCALPICVSGILRIQFPVCVPPPRLSPEPPYGHAEPTPTKSAPACSTENKRQPSRSEERRVGKECRSRWSPDH